MKGGGSTRRQGSRRTSNQGRRSDAEAVVLGTRRRGSADIRVHREPEVVVGAEEAERVLREHHQRHRRVLSESRDPCGWVQEARLSCALA